jgi:hypothetical protein
MSSIKQINGYIPTLCLKMTIVILLKSPLCHHPSEMLWFLCSNLKKGTFDCIFFLHNETHTFAWTTDFFFIVIFSCIVKLIPLHGLLILFAILYFTVSIVMSLYEHVS